MKFLVIVFALFASVATYALDGKSYKETLISTIKKQLYEKLNIKHAEVFISSPSKFSQQLQLKSIVLSKETFHAEMEAREGDQITVVGRFYPLTSVPVLKTNLPRGTIVTDNHIHRVLFRSDRMPSSAILKEDSAVGKVAKRNLFSNTLLQSYDLGKLLAVRRDARVTVAYLHSGLKMYLAGISLEDGGIGDVIKILNPRSGRAFSALVLDENKVEVRE